MSGDLADLVRRYRRYYTYIEPVVSDPVIRGYFSLAASLVLAAFLLVFALSPTVNTILALNKKIENNRVVLRRLEEKTRNLVAARQNYAMVADLVPLLEVAIPERAMPHLAIGAVLNSASISGVSVTAMRFKNVDLGLEQDLGALGGANDTRVQPALAVMVPTISFSLAVSGPNLAMEDFLKRVESQLHYVRLTNLTRTGLLESGSVAVDVGGVGYYYGPQ